MHFAHGLHRTPPRPPPGSTDNNPYTHYSLLRTVEENFGLGNLGRGDANATVYKFK
jgi:hypothetical protein